MKKKKICLRCKKKLPLRDFRVFYRLFENVCYHCCLEMTNYQGVHLLKYTSDFYVKMFRIKI